MIGGDNAQECGLGGECEGWEQKVDSGFLFLFFLLGKNS